MEDPVEGSFFSFNHIIELRRMAGAVKSLRVGAIGYLCVMFSADAIDETLERLCTRGAQRVGDEVQYKDAYRLCYIGGPEGVLIASPENSADHFVRLRLTGP